MVCLAAEQRRREDGGAGQSAGPEDRLGAATQRAHHCKGQMHLPARNKPATVDDSLAIMNGLGLTDLCVLCAECAGESGSGREGQSPAATDGAGRQRAGSEGLCQTLSNPSGKKGKNMLLSDIVRIFFVKCTACCATQEC